MARKVTKNPRFPSPVALLVLLGLLVVVAGAVLAYRHHHHANTAGTQQVTTSHGINYAPAHASDNATNNERKGSSTPASTLDNGPAASSSSDQSIQVSLNPSEANGNVHIGTLVNNATGGSCTLTASKAGSSPIVKTSSVGQDINNYDCGVFNIPSNDFTDGVWTFTLSVKNGEAQGSATQKLTITKD